MSARGAVVGAAVVGAGLNAGLFWAYQTSVAPAFRDVADRTYLEAFQRVNVAILNPVFGLVFVGTPIALVAATAVAGNPLRSRSAALLAVSAAVFVVGVLGVTGARNVPLNDRMARLDLATASEVELHDVRSSVEAPWNRWNVVRTVASAGAFVLAVAAAIDGVWS